MALAPVRTVVIPVAGLATRALPASKVVPKALFPIGDRPAIQYLAEEAFHAGLRRIILVISGPQQGSILRHLVLDEALRELFQHRETPHGLADLWRLEDEVEVDSVIQTEPKGLGHAVLQAAPFLEGEERFAVMLGDEIVIGDPPPLKALVDATSERFPQAITTAAVPPEDVHRYGIVGGDDVGGGLVHIRQMVEKPSPAEAPGNLSITGRYVLSTAVFKALETTAPDKKGEIQLTNGIRAVINDYPMLSVPLVGTRMDIGNPIGFARANRDWLRLKGIE